jgi:hypothetical protein
MYANSSASRKFPLNFFSKNACLSAMELDMMLVTTQLSNFDWFWPQVANLAQKLSDAGFFALCAWNQGKLSS